MSTKAKIILGVVVVVAAISAYYYFKVYKPKQEALAAVSTDAK